MKIKAFTLMEVLIALSVIGVLSVIMYKNINSGNFIEKTFTAKAYKVIELFEQAAADIRENDPDNCPMGTFIYSEGSNKYYQALVLPDVNTSQRAVEIFGNVIRFEETGFNFCEYSGICDSSSANYAGARLMGDVYIGINVLPAVADCRDYYLPDGDQVTVQAEFATGQKPKCWADLYIDTNGSDEPNEEGKDVFIYGLDKNGVHH